MDQSDLCNWPNSFLYIQDSTSPFFASVDQMLVCIQHKRHFPVFPSQQDLKDFVTDWQASCICYDCIAEPVKQSLQQPKWKGHFHPDYISIVFLEHLVEVSNTCKPDVLKTLLSLDKHSSDSNCTVRWYFIY